MNNNTTPEVLRESKRLISTLLFCIFPNGYNASNLYVIYVFEILYVNEIRKIQDSAVWKSFSIKQEFRRAEYPESNGAGDQIPRPLKMILFQR